MGIYKRGDTSVRTMLMHGARAVIARCQRSGWIERLFSAPPLQRSGRSTGQQTGPISLGGPSCQRQDFRPGGEMKSGW
jgi:hypothetical protein